MYTFTQETLDLLLMKNDAIKREVIFLLQTFNSSMNEHANEEFAAAFTASSEEARTFFVHSLLVET
jgi:hypothetical protein